MSPLPLPEVSEVAQTIQLAVAPIFLLAGVGAFLNVCAGRLSRIVDRARDLEPRILETRGTEHDRLIAQIRILDRRMVLVSRAIFLAVLSAILTCAVVVLLFAAGLTGLSFGTPIAILFIATMVAVGAGFFVFLIETRLGAKAVRISSEILQHEAAEQD
jgi:MFS family permease